MKSEFEKAQAQRILACYSESEIDLEKGGKPAFIGERRTHTDQSEWIKTSSGWVRVKDYKAESSSSDTNTNQNINNDVKTTKTKVEPQQERQDDKKKQETKPVNKNDPDKNTQEVKKVEDQHKQQTTYGEKPKEEKVEDAAVEDDDKSPKVEKTKGTKSLSKTGSNTLKEFEELRLNAYPDIAGKWTIGYGSRFYKNGTAVKKGDKVTKEQASDLFDETLKSYVSAVNKKVKVPITQNQFDALVLFTYNAGPSSGHSLFEKLNNEDYKGAAAEFDKWTKITDPKTKKKKVSKNLTSRRKKEKALFLKGN